MSGGVRLTIGVHDGEDVKVVLVEERLDLLILGLIPVDELKSDVFDSLNGQQSL